jgi:hypothetical protein
MVVFRLVSELYVRAVAELYLSGVGVLFDVLHSHKWLAFKRLAAENLVGFPLAGQCVKLSSVKGLRGRVLFRTKGEAERYAETARRELEKLGIDSALEVVASGVYYQVVFDEKTLTRLAEVDAAVKLAIERLEVLSTPHIAVKPIVATRLDAKPERLVKPKAAAKREERPRPKTATPEAVGRVVFQLVDGPASMRLKLTYVMKESKEDVHCKRRGAVFCVGGG